MNYSGPEMAPWRWLGEAGDPLSLRAPCPARDFGTHTPCPSPASTFPSATGNATSCGDVAQPRQGSVPKGWGRPWVLPGCAAGAGARPCCGSCRCPRGPCCVTRVCLAPAGSGDVSRQRQELKVPGAATTAACPPPCRRHHVARSVSPVGLEPGWASSSCPLGHQDGDTRMGTAQSPACIQPWHSTTLLGGRRGDSPGGNKHPKTRARRRCPRSALRKDTGAGLGRAVPAATGAPGPPPGTTGAPGHRRPQGSGRPRCNRQRFVLGLWHGEAEQRCLCAAQVKRPQAHVGCAVLGALPGPQGGSRGHRGGVTPSAGSVLVWG